MNILEVVGVRLSSTVLLGVLLGCNASDGNGDASLGTLSMPLTAEVNGVHYRLSDDTFFLTGPVTGNLQHNGNGAIVYAALPEGDYDVELVGGWTFQRQGESGFVPVEAELISPNPRPVQIVSGTTVIVAWVFRTDGVPVGLEPPGLFQGNLAVVDSTNPSNSILGDVLVSNEDQVAALSGIATIYGSLTIGPFVGSLTGLASLTTIDGSLQIDGNTALGSLRELSSLSSVDALAITNNPALPTCEAEWLVDNMTVTLGGSIGDAEPEGVEPGSVNISGNDDAGVCP